MKIAIAEYCRRFSRRLASPIRSLTSSVGHWQASQEGFVSDYVIENDGTFTGYVAQNGTPLWTCAGKWTLSGKTVCTVLTRSSSDKIPVGTKDRKVIVEVTSESCSLQLSNGSILKYSKVP